MEVFMKSEKIIDKALNNSLFHVRHIMANMLSSTESDDEPTLEDYGVSFDWISPDDFPDIRIGYYKWQISCGGPDTEYRFFADKERNVDKVEYWYKQWNDAAMRPIQGEDFKLLVKVFNWFEGID
jgi:hypothetical protein